MKEEEADSCSPTSGDCRYEEACEALASSDPTGFLWCTEDTSLTVAVLPSLPEILIRVQSRWACIFHATALWIPCPGFSQLCPVTHHFTCVCASHQTVVFFGLVWFFFWASTVTFLKYLALFAVGGMSLVCSRWIISATTCCQVGWQSMDCLWITLCVYAWAGYSMEGTYGLDFLYFCPSARAWSNLTKESIF